MTDAGSLESLLIELEAVLDAERQALRVLDREAITHAADEKLRLDAALRAVPSPVSTAALQERIKRVQRTARINQVLLAHARSCVQGMLQLLTGQNTSPVSRTGSAPPPPPVAVNFRG
jgi:hypothetical protein